MGAKSRVCVCGCRTLLSVLVVQTVLTVGVNGMMSLSVVETE